MAKKDLAKRNLLPLNQGLNTQPHNYQGNAKPINHFTIIIFISFYLFNSICLLIYYFVYLSPLIFLLEINYVLVGDDLG